MRHDVHVGISSILDEGKRQIIDVIEVSRHASVLHHVEERQQDVRRSLTEPDVGIETVLEKKRQQVPNKLESGGLVLVSRETDIFRGSKVQDV